MLSLGRHCMAYWSEIGGWRYIPNQSRLSKSNPDLIRRPEFEVAFRTSHNKCFENEWSTNFSVSSSYFAYLAGVRWHSWSRSGARSLLPLSDTFPKGALWARCGPGSPFQWSHRCCQPGLGFSARYTVKVSMTRLGVRLKLSCRGWWIGTVCLYASDVFILLSDHSICIAA